MTGLTDRRLPNDVRVTVEQSLPGGLDHSDWALLREVIEAVRQGLSDAADRRPGAVFEHVLSALRASDAKVISAIRDDQAISTPARSISLLRPATVNGASLSETAVMGTRRSGAMSALSGECAAKRTSTTRPSRLAGFGSALIKARSPSLLRHSAEIFDDWEHDAIECHFVLALGGSLAVRRRAGAILCTRSAIWPISNRCKG